MPKQSINTLKGWFKKGLKPLEAQFSDWLDSYFHKDENIPVEKIQGLTEILNTLPSGIALDGVLQLIKTRGVIIVDNTSDLQEQRGADSMLTLVKEFGLFTFELEGDPDGEKIFPALGDGVWSNALPVVVSALADVLAADNSAEGTRIVDLADPVDPQDADTRAARDLAITAAINNLVNAAPGALDTLNELAAALANDPNFATTITNALAMKAALESPALTGIPTAPTAIRGTTTTQLATTAFVVQQIDEAIVDRGTVNSGTLVFDLSRKNHKVTLTGPVVLGHTNLIPGREYKVWVTRTTNTPVNFQADQWDAPLKMAPGFTDPTLNGSIPARAVDILSFCASDTPGALPTIVITPDSQKL